MAVSSNVCTANNTPWLPAKYALAVRPDVGYDRGVSPIGAVPDITNRLTGTQYCDEGTGKINKMPL